MVTCPVCGGVVRVVAGIIENYPVSKGAAEGTVSPAVQCSGGGSGLNTIASHVKPSILPPRDAGRSEKLQSQAEHPCSKKGNWSKVVRFKLMISYSIT